MNRRQRGLLAIAAVHRSRSAPTRAQGPTSTARTDAPDPRTTEPEGETALLSTLRVPGRVSNSASKQPVARLRAGEVRKHVDIVLAPNGIVSGKVTAPSGKTIGDATVLISVRVPGTWNYDRVPVETDQRGRFSYRVPRSGHTVLEAMAEGYAPSKPLAFTLQPGSNRSHLKLVLHAASYSVAGHV